MPEFPSFRGTAKVEEYNIATFGTGTYKFQIQAYGWRNLEFMLAELQESIEYAKKECARQLDK